MNYTMIRLDLKLSDRWAIGRIPDPAGEVDLPVLVDPRNGKPYLPGTTLAGALRRHLGDAAEQWLGPEPTAFEESRKAEPPSSESDPEPPQRSPLGFLGSQVGEVAAQDRGATRVNPRRGAAEAGSLRTEQWNEPGTVLVALEYTGAEQIESELLSQLLCWAPTLGRGASTGLGRAHVARVSWIRLKLTDADHLTWWLAQRDQWWLGTAAPPATVAGGTETPPDSANDASLRATATTRWKLREPLHVGTGEPEQQSDGRQLLSTMKLGDRPMVPGSSWKGVFRHRVEHILRVVGADPQPICEALFGSTATGRGLLTFHDSILKGGSWQKQRHTAIDRFTGGVLDGALYEVEAVRPGTPIDLAITSPQLPDSVRNLLRHVQRDLHDGLIGVGGMSTRGYGLLACTSDRFDDLEAVNAAAIAAELGVEPQTEVVTA